MKITNKVFEIGDTVYYSYYSDSVKDIKTVECKLLDIEVKRSPIGGYERKTSYTVKLPTSEVSFLGNDRFKTLDNVSSSPDEAIDYYIKHTVQHASMNTPYQFEMLECFIEKYNVDYKDVSFYFENILHNIDGFIDFDMKQIESFKEAIIENENKIKYYQDLKDKLNKIKYYQDLKDKLNKLK